MGKINKKPKKFNGKKPRKVIRKEKRQEKKKRKLEYYVNRNKSEIISNKKNLNNKETIKNNTEKGKGKKQKNNVDKKKNKSKSNNEIDDNEIDINENEKRKNITKKGNNNKNMTSNAEKFVDRHTKEVLDDKRKQQKLQKEMRKRRKHQLEEANLEEDRVIKRLAKDLKLNKRKTNAIPKSFTLDGLDYLLEVCDPENVKNIASSENILDANDDFEEDFELITGKTKKVRTGKNANEDDEESDESLELDEDTMESDEDLNMDENNDTMESDESSNMDDDENINDSDENMSIDSDEDKNNKKKKKDKVIIKKTMDYDNSDSENDMEEETKNKKKKNKKQKNKKMEDKDLKGSKEEFSDSNEVYDDSNEEFEVSNKEISDGDEEINDSDEEISDNDEDINDSNEENDDSNEEMDDSKNSNEDDVWEDIYGRKRSKDGSVINQPQQKYIPPALRAQNDSKRSEKLLRLKRQIKGLINRLAENNMHSISSQIEDLYMNNSRNDMNETLTQIIFDSLISPVITPERLLLEHVMLITILHANVGTEVGAHFLLNVIRKFDSLIKLVQDVGNKELDNTVHIIAQLYNFKIFHAQLLYQIIEQLSNKFEEKHVECILLILKSVGFSLRKDDPMALKQIIVDLQKKATSVSSDDPRVKFLLDILLAIKNNNVTKIPNYDTTYSEHLKKLLKGFIRKGNYVTQLNISIDDLLKADERGKWWVVGSAWSGMDDKKTDKTLPKTSAYSQKLLALAKKHRMNTDIRRNIFCIIMSAEDYLDAFEKLLHLGLKNQQEREIIHVILHCCLSEKKFNPYYAVLANKFCEYDRKYQMTVRCSIWDKLKALDDCSASQLSNLAKLLAYLFIEQSLPISTLKVIEFTELDKITLRFIRQVLLQILLHENDESCLEVFSKVAVSPKLKMFRDSLRLFIHHFLLKNLKEGVIGEDQRELLMKRAEMVEKVLVTADHKSQFF